MAIGSGSLIEVSLIGQLAGGKFYNVFQYEVDPLPGGVTPVQLAEGWWNHVKATYRALYGSGAGNIFQEVKLVELDTPTGDYATFPVPVGERAGTRSAPSPGTFQASFMATGVRLTVGSRVTRPGQKRLPLVYEADNEGDALDPAWITLVNSWGAVVSAAMVLGSPAATATLYPKVVRKDLAGGVLASQLVTGYLTNPRPTSQVSRKYGRGF